MSCSYTPGLTAVGSGAAFDEWEKAALPIAGEAAGALLDGWGKTDLATLSEAEWIEFLKCVVVEFGNGVRAQARSGKAPF